MRGRLLLGACALLVGGCANGPQGGPTDGGVEAAADAPLEAMSTCVSALSCNAVNDCVRTGTLAACWQCLLHCCVPVTPGNDPQQVCDAGSACFLSSCDGAGSCSVPLTADDGTPCGTTCGGVFVFGRSSCRNGVCVGEPSTQTACPDRCFGDYTSCSKCDPTGCVASCTALPNHPDRCFP